MGILLWAWWSLPLNLQEFVGLETPELLYKSLAAKLVVGMPLKDLASVDSILLRELPPADDSDAFMRSASSGPDSALSPTKYYSKRKSCEPAGLWLKREIDGL